jgi:hypothetical protein
VFFFVLKARVEEHRAEERRTLQAEYNTLAFELARLVWDALDPGAPVLREKRDRARGEVEAKMRQIEEDFRSKYGCAPVRRRWVTREGGCFTALALYPEARPEGGR